MINVHKFVGKLLHYTIPTLGVVEVGSLTGIWKPASQGVVVLSAPPRKSFKGGGLLRPFNKGSFDSLRKFKCAVGYT